MSSSLYSSINRTHSSCLWHWGLQPYDGQCAQMGVGTEELEPWQSFRHTTATIALVKQCQAQVGFAGRSQ